jgi:hypothetical protein
MQREGTGSLSSGEAPVLRDRARPQAFTLARKRAPRIAARGVVEDTYPTMPLQKKNFYSVQIFLVSKTDSRWALL